MERRDFLKIAGAGAIGLLGLWLFPDAVTSVEASTPKFSADEIIDRTLGEKTENSGQLGSLYNPKNFDGAYHGYVDDYGIYHKVSGSFWSLNDDGLTFGWNQDSSERFSPHIPYEISGYYPVLAGEVNGMMTFQYVRVQ